jgi:hypothetical protein
VLAKAAVAPGRADCPARRRGSRPRGWRHGRCCIERYPSDGLHSGT